MNNSNTSQLRVVFPYVSLPSFIQTDVDTLRSRYCVQLTKCNRIADIISGLRFVFWADCVFCWFGSLRFIPFTLIARILNKKVIIIAGGYDVANVPEISYGNMRAGLTRYLGRLLFKTAHVVACFSRSGLDEARVNAGVAPDKLRLIYLGYDPDFAVGEKTRKRKIVLTVGNCDLSSIYRKGFLAVAKVSRLLPDVPFVFAGQGDEDAFRILQEAAGPNVTFAGRVSQEELHALFSEALIYLQPSIHEGFGAAVAEAMLYECIPIVSNRFSLPEVVGDCGFYVDPYNLDAMASTIKQALETNVSFPEPASQRILRLFPAARRRELLFEMVDELCHQGSSQTR